MVCKARLPKSLPLLKKHVDRGGAMCQKCETVEKAMFSERMSHENLNQEQTFGPSFSSSFFDNHSNISYSWNLK